jgi:hypothetical protein
VQAGPQFGTLVSAKGEVPDGNGGTTKIDKNSYKNSDLSAAFGFGWDAPLGINITARYVVGLSDISVASATDTKNRMFQLGIGYKFIKIGR